MHLQRPAVSTGYFHDQAGPRRRGARHRASQPACPNHAYLPHAQRGTLSEKRERKTMAAKPAPSGTPARRADPRREGEFQLPQKIARRRRHRVASPLGSIAPQRPTSSVQQLASKKPSSSQDRRGSGAHSAVRASKASTAWRSSAPPATGPSSPDSIEESFVRIRVNARVVRHEVTTGRGNYGA